jgi:perosamine synthetase
MANPRGKETLAIHGGVPVRQSPMPPRVAFGDAEVASLMEAVEYYRSRNEDPPYQGIFEERFCNAFVDYMGGGYADAVASGTIACFIAVAALELKKGSEVIISPVTDSGPLNCLIMQGLVPVVADSMPNSFNMGVEQFIERITPNTSAVFAVHCAGEPLDITRITEEAHKRGIKVIEDCSQAPGARWNEQLVGSIGDTAAFSTMYRKSLAAGATGGIVFTNDKDLYHQSLGHADRGKQVWRDDINLNDPSQALFPALNMNTDELSCAIGLASLGRLEKAISGRVDFITRFIELLNAESRACRPYAFHQGFSPFFFPIFVDTNVLSCSKIEFAEALVAEGVPLNVHYGCVISAWEFAKPYLSDDFQSENALSTRDRSFNLFVNEQFTETEAQDILAAIIKVENHFYRA